MPKRAPCIAWLYSNQKLQTCFLDNLMNMTGLKYQIHVHDMIWSYKHFRTCVLLHFITILWDQIEDMKLHISFVCVFYSPLAKQGRELWREMWHTCIDCKAISGAYNLRSHSTHGSCESEEKQTWIKRADFKVAFVF